MYEVYRDGAFPDCRSDALYVSGPDVPDRENPGHASLQHLWRAGQVPAERRIAAQGGFEIAAGENESLVIESETALQPLGPRRGARHYEYVSDIVTGCLAGFLVEPLHAFEVGVALQFRDFRVVVQLYIRIFGDSLNQVA